MLNEKESRIRACISRHPDWNDRRIAASARAVNAEVAAVRGGSGEKMIPITPLPASSISVGEFLKRLDYDKMLAETISRNCRNKFIVESQMRTLSGVPPNLWRSVADLERFENCHVYDSGKNWWSTEENVKQVQAKKKYWGIVR